MAAAFKNPCTALLVATVLFCMSVSSETTKSGKLYSASFKNGELRVFKSGKSPVTILIPVKREDRSEAGDVGAADGRPARSALVLRLLEEEEAEQEGEESLGGPDHTQALFPAPASARAKAKDSLQVTDPKYEFLYKVRDHEGNNYGHMESRLGQKSWGEYFVHLPDGRMQTVRYWADLSGFHAEVSYQGHASHSAAGAGDPHEDDDVYR